MQLEERSTGDVVIVKVSGEITLKKNRNTMLHDKVRGLVQQGHKTSPHRSGRRLVRG